MPVPTNTTPATALLITGTTYDVTLDAGLAPTDTLWFRWDKTVGGYTALASAAAVNLISGVYIAQLTVYTGTPSSLTIVNSLDQAERPVTVPLAQTTISYFFGVENGGTPLFDAQLRFQWASGPVAGAGAGSIAVNDDDAGLPMMIVDTTTGEVLQAFPFVSGEYVAMLPSGITLWDNTYNTGQFAALYTPQMALITAVGVPPSFTNTTGFAVLTQSPTTFYMGRAGDSDAHMAKVTTVSATGTIGTLWTLNHRRLWVMAVDHDDTILYYIRNSTTDTLVRTWVLGTNTAGPTFVAGVDSYHAVRDILVLPDDSVLVGYWHPDITPHQVRRYSAAGALLNTYTTGETLNRMADAHDGGVSFWVWLFEDGQAVSRFKQIRISDGAVLSNVAVPTSNSGQFIGEGSGSPEAGVSDSCPLLIIPEPLPPITFGPPAAEPGSYSIGGAPATLVYSAAPPATGERTVPQRRLRRAPHLADEQRWLTYDRFQLDLQTGVGLVTGQGEDPQIMLRWSNDGGHTWSNEHWVSAGRMGATKTRAIWRQLGRARTRTFEVVVSDSVRWYIAQALVDVTAGDS